MKDNGIVSSMFNMTPLELLKEAGKYTYGPAPKGPTNITKKKKKRKKK